MFTRKLTIGNDSVFLFNRITDELGKNRVRCFGVYTGERQVLADHATILPVLEFLKKLWAGELL